jgi:hypothetical protein
MAIYAVQLTRTVETMLCNVKILLSDTSRGIQKAMDMTGTRPCDGLSEVAVIRKL